MKKILAIFAFLVPFVGSAAGSDAVTLMTDLPLIGSAPSLAGLLKGLFQLTLGVAVTGAVVLIVVNGIRYMVSDVAGNKEDAKSWIYDVIWGLILAFASVLILSAINPRLTQFDFINTLQNVGSTTTTGGGEHVPPQPPGGSGIPNEAAENALRQDLASHGITASRPCKVGEVTQDGCVTLYGLPGSATNGLITLAEEQCSCSLRVTGGVEPGHDTHGVGKPMVDLGRGTKLTTLITENGILIRPTCLGNLYSFGGSEYLSEGDHWHVCFGTSCSFAPGC